MFPLLFNRIHLSMLMTTPSSALRPLSTAAPPTPSPSPDSAPPDALTRPVVIAGPSGVGKSTLIRRLMAKYPHAFGFAVSHCTRQPRPGEEDGAHYHFVDHARFQALAQQRGFFVEHAQFAGNCYGTSLDALHAVAQQGRVPVLDIDVQGVRQIRQIPSLFPACLFLQPPSLQELSQRLHARGDTSKEAIAKRLATAASEISASQEQGLFDAVLVSGAPEVIWNEFERTVLAFNRHIHYH